MEGTNGQRATDADNYHYFAHDNGGGVSGIAGVGTVCRTSRRSRTAISEWIGSADSHYAENQCMLVGNKYVSIDVMPLKSHRLSLDIKSEYFRYYRHLLTNLDMRSTCHMIL